MLVGTLNIIRNRGGELGKEGETIKIEKDYIEVACGNGTIKIKELKIEGKNKVEITQFLCGYRNKIKTPFFITP
ncbi:MAG: hypothetical protein NC833_07355 [Candidatus Omnitrophica bacterium]|nr:hypothetical protein [Candidatus Omnitrophota bacterium]